MSAGAKAAAAWGDAPPAWVTALAAACDAASLRTIAARLDVSPALVSLALNNKRKQYDFLRDRVTMRLMAETVTCPVLGDVSGSECARERSRPFSSANPLRVQLYRACRNGCPNYREKKQ